MDAVVYPAVVFIAGMATSYLYSRVALAAGVAVLAAAAAGMARSAGLWGGWHIVAAGVLLLPVWLVGFLLGALFLAMDELDEW